MPRSRRTSSNVNMEPNLITDQKLTTVIDRHLINGDYKSALFWAGKRLALFESQDYEGANTGTSPVELARYLKVLTAASEWQSIIAMIAKLNLQTRHVVFAYFYANALFHVGRYDDIAAMPLGHLLHVDGHPFVTSDIPVTVHLSSVRPVDDELRQRLDDMNASENITSQMLVLMARTYDTLQNRPAAKIVGEAAIRANPYAVEPIEFMIDKHLLTVAKIREILSTHQVAEEDQPLMDVITVLLNRYDHDPAETTNESLAVVDRILASDASMLNARAIYFHSHGHLEKAYEITSKIIKTFGVAHKCLHLHLACCVELAKTTEIYEIAHTLATTAPEDPRTFYSVGCYYFSAKQYHQAKDFFHKCVVSYPHDGFCWIAYGHSLALCNEHEQSMNCYMMATRYLENYMEPFFYMGIQYIYSNSLTQALQAFTNAEELSPNNPLIYHERATVHVIQREYPEAYKQYYTALKLLCHRDEENPRVTDMINDDLDSFWSPLIFNLGFTLFKLKKITKAITCYHRAIQLGYEVTDTWAHIGYCYLSTGRAHQGVSALTKALAKDPHAPMVKRAYDRATYLISVMDKGMPSITDKELDAIIASVPKFVPKKVDTRPTHAPHLLGDTIRESSLHSAEEVHQRHRPNDFTGPRPEAAAAIAAANVIAATAVINNNNNNIPVPPIVEDSEAQINSGESAAENDSGSTQETVLSSGDNDGAPAAAAEEPEAGDAQGDAPDGEDEPEEDEEPMSSAAAALMAAAQAALAVDAAAAAAALVRVPTPHVSPVPGPSTDRQSRRTHTSTPHPGAGPRPVLTQRDSDESSTRANSTRAGSPSDPLTGILNVPTDRHPPMMDIDDTHQLFSQWLMEDNLLDTIRVPDDVMVELRPTPLPRPDPVQEGSEHLPTSSQHVLRPPRHVYRQR